MSRSRRPKTVIREPPDSIRSVANAFVTLNWLEHNFFDPELWPGHTFPFGLWFRGHADARMSLEPGAFREKLKVDATDTGAWDETNVYEHLRLRVPLHQRLYQSAFDWLSLMQHYLLPTRLLDWSESILPALFFASRENSDVNGELIALNAKRLNHRSKRHPTISTPTDGHIVIRAEMATTRSLRALCLKTSVRTALAEACIEQADLSGASAAWSALQRPIAVFPSRLNDRMTYQSSVFTLHGGKKYPAWAIERYDGDLIPTPIGLTELDDDKDAPLIWRFTIPKGFKKRILDELLRLGIHEGTLFPEVDRQESYLETLWWFPNTTEGRDPGETLPEARR